MKKYLLFTFGDYYPCGGMNDYEGAFDSVEEAMRAFSSKAPSRYESAQIVAYSSMLVVANGRGTDQDVEWR